jgi:hypothetical protein
MMNTISQRCLILLIVAALCSCGSESVEPEGDTTAATDSRGETNGPPKACSDTSGCSANETCSGTVCVAMPSNPIKVTNNLVDEPVDLGPNLECVGGVLTAPDGPSTVTAYGIVDRFGGGRETSGIEVSFFRASEWPPAECTTKSVEEQRDCFRVAESTLKAVSTSPAEGSPAVPSQCTKHADCPLGYDCIEVDVEYHCEPQHGLYEIAGVPTNTLLVIRATNTVPILEKKWKDTYVYGVYLYADRVDADGRYRVNSMMVSDGQWKTIPNTLLVKGGIKKNNGAIGGRIRDCRTADRDSYTLGEATVGLATLGSATGYFNDDEEDTVPLLDSNDTDIYGRFAAVDVPSGPNAVGAAILYDGVVTPLGSESVYVIPDSLSVVSFPGKQPILLK